MPLAVLPDNHQVWRVWELIGRQWLLATNQSSVGWICIDIVAADVVRKALGIKGRAWRRVLEELREMERAAVPLLNST